MEQDMEIMTLEECIKWTRNNMPFAIKPLKKAKTDLVYPYSSRHAQTIVAKCIGEHLYLLLKEKCKH